MEHILRTFENLDKLTDVTTDVIRLSSLDQGDYARLMARIQQIIAPTDDAVTILRAAVGPMQYIADWLDGMLLIKILNHNKGRVRFLVQELKGEANVTPLAELVVNINYLSMLRVSCEFAERPPEGITVDRQPLFEQSSGTGHSGTRILVHRSSYKPVIMPAPIPALPPSRVAVPPRPGRVPAWMGNMPTTPSLKRPPVTLAATAPPGSVKPSRMIAITNAAPSPAPLVDPLASTPLSERPAEFPLASRSEPILLLTRSKQNSA